jgi:4-diphosphocytidyl-2C-methyl-D-erythritol kinase
MRPRWSEIDTLLSRGAQFGLFYRMSGSGSTVFKVTGVTTRPIQSRDSLPAMVVPPGTRSLITRTSTSVVPIELLD